NGGAVIFSLRHLRAGLDVSALDTAEDRVLYRSSEPGGAFDISEDGSLLYAANGSTGVMRVVKVGEMVELSLTPDYTRDGVVDGSDKGSVTWDKPWRFWVNDDDDGAADAATGLDGEDLPGSNKDNSDAVVNGIRDLVDLFPLRIDLAEALKAWPPGEGFRYRLKQADSAVTVFEGMAGDLVLTTETAGSYLTDLDVASAFRSARGKVVGPNGVELSPEFLALTSANAASGIVLVEGRARSAQPLVLEISDSNGRFVRSASMAMELAGVEEMYGRKDLRSVAGGTNDAGDRQDMEKLPYNMADSGKSLVWVHGYRVSPENAKATFAEVFKRFYQSGLKGRFYGVSWYGDPLSLSLGEADLGVNYHQSVVNAFATADAFAAFVKTLGDDVSVAAHSLGNLVAGEALQNGLAVKNYFAVDAAVALEAYGETPDFEADGKFNSGGKHASMVKVKDWPDYIDAGQSRLLASEWHKLFGEGDGRSGLTWRGRLGGVPSGNVYNFYSSTEDVLRAYDGDNLVVDEAGSAWGMYSWVKQEKFKGRLDEVVNIAGAASPYCGWSLNPYWTIIGEGGAIRTLSPSEARDRISDTDLKTHPFFRLHQTGLFSGPDINELVADDNGATASAFLSKPVSATSLTNYYEKNKAAHGKVTVRDWLLAEAFPATTLAAGGNRSEQMAQKENNIDMSTDIKANGFMTNAARWPRRETIENMGRDWRHSDYKDIAYQHVFTFYKKIDELIGH
ncbi:MAG: alpha/beta hydrolase, partial [Nitrospirae bacterium]|nr:alpha/beta hydrolase [Nitrospirota bacterium]